jgi:hypothetical protein
LRSIAVFAFAFTLATIAHAQTTLRYDLQNGDHLIYRESVDRSFHGKTSDFATHAEFINHVIVTADPRHPELFVVAVQRNRTKGEQLRSTVDGKDTTKADRKELEGKLALRGPAFVEASRYDRTALPLDPIPALREWAGQTIFDARELMPLPVEPISIGSAWHGASLLGIVTHYAANESLHGHDCLRLEGEDTKKIVGTKTWFCPATGLAEKIELTAKQPEGPDASLQENVSFEFVSRTRGELPGAWRSAAETSQAWLQMAMLDASMIVDPDSLLPLLSSDDTHLQRRTLALWYRRRFPPPSPEVIARLTASIDPRVHSLASLIANTSAAKPEPACAAPAKSHDELPPGDYWLTMNAGPVPGWPYIVHIPEEYRSDTSLPTILYLSGGNGRALDGMTDSRTAEETTGYVLIYPHARDYWWKPPTIEIVRELLPEVKGLFAIDPDHFYVSGMSNGGSGTFDYATLWPDQFAAAAPLMGAGFDAELNPAEKPLGENTSALPMLFIHGDRDPIIPMKYSTEAVDRLKAMDRSAPVDLIILPGKGHELGLDQNGGNVLPFFKRYQRNPYPKKLHVRMRDLKDPRQYWIELLDKSDGLAEIDAKIEGNTITVKSKNVRKLRLRLRPELVGGEVKVIWNGKAAWQGEVAQDCAMEVKTAPDGDLALGYSREVVLEGEHN